MTPEIPGLNEGVGLVPQGRLGSGIANVFDTGSVAANLARLGARMENLEKLKLATAAKLATAKQKETIAKGIKSNPFEAVAAAGKAAFRSGQRVNAKEVEAGLNEFIAKKSAGDVEGANQVIPLTRYKSENINNKTASIESDIDNFWKNGAGKYYLPNDVVESNIENARPDNYQGYLSYNEMPVRTQSYRDNPSTYNVDAVGQWAKDESGRTTLQKTLPDGTFASVSGLSALYKFPTKKNGEVDTNADLEIDYDVAKNFYATNPFIREQMVKFGENQKEKAMLSDDYKKATTDVARTEILKKAIDQGENSYIYATLAGRGDKDVRSNLEATYRRAAAQKKAEGDVQKDYQYGDVPLNVAGRVLAPSLADPKKKQGVSFDYSFGVVPSYNFSKNPQQLSNSTKVVPMGDPLILTKLGLLTKKATAKGTSEYILNRGLKFGSAFYVKGATINQTPNRKIIGPKVNYIMPTGVMLPNGYTPYTTDQKADGFIVNISVGGTQSLSKEDKQYLIDEGGFTLQQINQGLEIPVFVSRDDQSGASLVNFINNEFPKNPIGKNTTLTTSGY